MSFVDDGLLALLSSMLRIMDLTLLSSLTMTAFALFSSGLLMIAFLRLHVTMSLCMASLAIKADGFFFPLLREHPLIDVCVEADGFFV